MKKKPITSSFASHKGSFNQILISMKILILLTLLGAYNAAATVSSQTTVSLEVKDKTVKHILKEVEEKTQYRFLYNDDFTDLNKVVSVKADNADVETVLNDLLVSANVSYQILDDDLVVITPNDQYKKQNHTIKGMVTDAQTGEPLTGVTIALLGTTTGTVTDVDGEYTLTVEDSQAILQVSYIGYLTQTINIDGQTDIDIQLQQDLQLLDEVVVVGYGSMKRSDITGSVVSVSEEKLQSTVNTSIDQALQGRAAGVQVFQNSGQPGGGVSIRIRGSNSVNSTSEPLYVIDGVPVSGESTGTAMGFDWAGGGNGQTAVSALSSINPSDIVSVEILKDASATAIYGARGANGVVLITTKRGEKNTSRVSYNPYVGMQQITKKLDVLNLTQYATYYNELAEEGWVNQREQFMDPSLLGNGTNWQDEVFRVAPVTNHQLSVTGGNDNTVYAFSAGYFQQDGIVTGSGFNRYSVRLNLENDAKDWLKVGNNFTVSRTNEEITLNDSNDGVIASTLMQAPDIPVRFLDGSWGGPVRNEFGVRNPIAIANDRDLSLIRSRILGNVYAEASFLQDFTFRSEFGSDIQFNNNYGFHPTYEYGVITNDINQSRRTFSQNFYWEVKNYLTWNKEINDQNRFTLLLGQEASESNWEGLMASRTTFLSNNVQEINAGDAETATNSGYKGSSSLLSFFGRLLYSFDDKYILTATLRRDGSSNFGPENKWGNFPSVAAAWRISSEDFMENINAVSNLRLRFSYGQVGNQNIGGYRYGSALANAPTGLGQSFRLSNIPNPLVKWESSTSYNIGFELGLFEQRIDLLVDLYQKTTDDMLLELPLPAYLGTGDWMGIQSPWVNAGELENRGVEVTLTTRNVNTSGFSWNSDIIFTHNQNELLSLGAEDAVIFQNVQWFTTVTKTEAGQPLGQFYGYVTDGIFESAEEIRNSATQHDNIDPDNGVWIGDIKFKDLNNDGVIDDNDRTYIGNPHPLFTYGFNNQFRIGNFDLSVYIQGSYGNDVFNFTRIATEGMNSPGFNQLSTVLDRAIVEPIDPEGDLNDPDNYQLANESTPELPRSTTTDPNDNRRVSDRYVEDGSYMRIQNLSLGYNIPVQWGANMGLSTLKVYASVQNLYTFSNYSGYDPEIGAYNQSPLLTGVDNGRYPLSRIYTLGLNITF